MGQREEAHLGGPLSGSITVLHDVKRTKKTQGRIYVLEKCDQLSKLLDAFDVLPVLCWPCRMVTGHLEAKLKRLVDVDTGYAGLDFRAARSRLVVNGDA